VFLAATTTSGLPIGSLLMGLLGGLALFLYGIDQMSEALKLVAGDRIKNILSRLTTNRFTGVLAGTLVTAASQSSSLTTVLVVGFISANLMTLTQSIGVIMGANIGTTITAQIIAFKVTQYALFIIAAGFALLLLARREDLKLYGRAILGLGLIFLGMQLMSDGTSPLRTYAPFIALMQNMDQHLLAILMGAGFTALIQSSLVTTGLVIVLAGQGLITLPAGIALVLGANVGTCVTAVLAALGKPREAVRAALVHVLFNAVGVALWYPFIAYLAELVTWLSPHYPDLSGAARLAAETPRQIANAHTVFNVANTLLLIWFATPLARLVRRLVPESPLREADLGRPKYLDNLLLETPSLAFDMVRLELGRMGAAVLQMTRGALDTVVYGNLADLNRLEQMDNDVDRLHGAIVTHLGRLSQKTLTDPQSAHLQNYLAAANYLENIGDVIETNLVDTGRTRQHTNLAISPATLARLRALHEKVCWAVERAIQALAEDDAQVAREVQAAKGEITRLAEDTEDHLSRRLAAEEPDRVAIFRLESELIEYLKRLYYFAKRVAKNVAEVERGHRPPAIRPGPQDTPA